MASGAWSTKERESSRRGARRGIVCSVWGGLPPVFAPLALLHSGRCCFSRRAGLVIPVSLGLLLHSAARMPGGLVPLCSLLSRPLPLPKSNGRWLLGKETSPIMSRQRRPLTSESSWSLNYGARGDHPLNNESPDRFLVSSVLSLVVWNDFPN